MTPPKPATGPASSVDQPETQTGHGVVSLLIGVHLLVVFIVLSSNLSRSQLQQRLVAVLRPYAQYSNLDPDFTPYYLTHATIDDVDHHIEILPRGADADDAGQWHVLPDRGWRGGERRRRYQRLARLMAEFADDDATVARLAKSVAEHYLAETGTEPAQIRCRKHVLQSWNILNDGTAAQRDPDAEIYFRVVYAANTIVSGERVDLVKIESAGQVARPVNGSSSTGGPANSSEPRQGTSP